MQDFVTFYFYLCSYCTCVTVILTFIKIVSKYQVKKVLITNLFCFSKQFILTHEHFTYFQIVMLLNDSNLLNLKDRSKVIVTYFTCLYSTFNILTTHSTLVRTIEFKLEFFLSIFYRYLTMLTLMYICQKFDC